MEGWCCDEQLAEESMYEVHAYFTIKGEDGKSRHEQLRPEHPSIFQDRATAVTVCDRIQMDAEFDLHKRELLAGEELLCLRAVVVDKDEKPVHSRVYPQDYVDVER